MILAAFSWLSLSIGILIGLFAIVCLLMSTVILMQRPKNEGLGAAFGSGMTDQLLGAKTTTVLQKGTVYLATAFFVLVLTLSILLKLKHKGEFSMVTSTAPAAEVTPAPEAPAVPETAPEETPATTTTPTPAPETTPEPVTPEETPAAPPVEDAPPAETTPEEKPAAPETTPPAEQPAPEQEPK